MPFRHRNNSWIRLSVPIVNCGCPAELCGDLSQEPFHLANDLTRGLLRHREGHVMAVELDLLVPLVVQAASGARSDEPVAPRPNGEMRHRRLVGDARQWRFVDAVPRDPLV